jgi:hypothetical protein
MRWKWWEIVIEAKIHLNTISNDLFSLTWSQPCNNNVNATDPFLGPTEAYLSVFVCVRGLINVESNAARDTHTP